MRSHLGRGFQEALAELGRVMRDRAGEHGLDLGRVTRDRRPGIRRYGDAEVADGAGVVLFEEHLQRPAGREVGRLGEAEDRHMVLAEAAEHLPAARHLAVKGGGGVVLLAIGFGRVGFRGGFLRRLRRGGGVVDPVLFLVVGGRRVAEGQSASALPGLEFVEEEAAERAFIVRQAGAVVRQRRVRPHFDADRDGSLDGAVEGQVVDVALRDVAAAEDEAVRLDVEGREGGLELVRTERLPLGGAPALGFQPFAEPLLDGGGAAGELAFEGFLRRADAKGVVGLPGFEVEGRDVVGRFVGVVEQGHHRVVVRVEHGVVLVRMALRAVEREAQPGRAGGADAVDHGVEAIFVRVGASFLVEHRVAVEARGDEVVGRGAGEQVAGQLLDAELVVRQVGVEGLHDPVAVRPDGARTVFLEAVRVGVAGEVEPATGPALAIARGGQQSVHEFIVGVGRLVLRESVGFFRGRGNAGEVEGHAAHEGVAVGFGRRLQAGLFKPGPDERVDRVDAASLR